MSALDNGKGWTSKFAPHSLALPGRIDIPSWHNKTAPDRRWIVPSIIPEGNVTMLGGDGGMGKSILALQLIVACALGKPWLGMETRPCKAVGFFCEDDQDELWRRIERIAAHYAAVPSDLWESVALYSRVGLDNALVEWRDPFAPGEPTDLFATVSNIAVDAGAELVVLDSLHDVFTGNENSRPHARQFIGELRGLAMQIRGGVLLTAHPSLSGRNTGTGEAGSTAWNNAVRSRLYLTAPKAEEEGDSLGDYRELKTMKSNYGVPGGRIMLRWQNGVFVPSEKPANNIVDQLDLDNAILSCARDLISNGAKLLADRNAVNSLTNRVRKDERCRAFKWASISAAQERLIAAGRLVRVELGPPSRRMVYVRPSDSLYPGELEA